MNKVTVLLIMLTVISRSSQSVAAPDEVLPPIPQTFRFITPDGAPAREKRVIYQILNKSGEPVRETGGGTDQQGRLSNLSASIAPGQYNFACLVSGAGYALQEIVFERGAKSINVEVQLSRGVTIAGTVVEEKTLQPVGGELLQVRGTLVNQTPNWTGMLHYIHGLSAYPPFIRADTTMISISRDGDGQFVLQNLPPIEYEIVPFFGEAWAHGSSPWKFERRFALRESQSITNVQIVVPALTDPRSFAGEVLKADGRTPVANTEITIRVKVAAEPRKGARSRTLSGRSLGIERTVVTDEKGHFRLYPFKPAIYVITALATGGSEKSDEANVDLSTRSVADVKFLVR